MSGRAVDRFGGIAAILVAAAYVASGLAAAGMPAELQARPDVTPHEFWMVLSRDPWAHLAYHVALAAVGIFGIAAVPAIVPSSAWVSPPLAWVNALAYLGFAVQTRSHLMELAFDRKIIASYADASPAFQEAVHVAAGLALDVPDGVLTHGAIGLWIVVATRVVSRSEGWPSWLRLTGHAAGLSLILGVPGYALLFRPFVVVSIGLGSLVLAPLWFVAIGARRLGESRHER